MECRQCKGKYHLHCLNIRKDQFLALSKECRTTWLCPHCNNITRRTRCNPNTSVTQNQVPPSDESVNMSMDSSDRVASVDTASAVSEEPVTMDKIRQLFDDRLNSSLTAFMHSFRAALHEDVRVMVQAEMKSTVQELKNDFNQTITFISDEQATLKTQINNKDETIKKLETENLKLQADLVKLNSRLSSMEKMSRGLNIELQAVPESRNENVMSLFKKICETVDVHIDDPCIQACRRVAKMDAKSNRPRNILVTLSSPRLRDTILSSVHRYNKSHPKDPLSTRHLGLPGETRKIYVTEHLSPECKSLYAQTRKIAKEKNYKYVWVKYARIYMRKNDESGHIYVKDLSTLNKLK